MSIQAKGPRSAYVTAASREIHVTEWGDPSNPPVILWHGLARTGRDFDPLASQLAEHYFLLAPDTLGRGLSQWAKDPKAEYCLDNYGKLALDLLDAYGLGKVRWVGTSMGGAIGMHIAGGDAAERITHLVINDIGPEIPEAAVERILAYAGNPPTLATMMELEAALRQVYAPFGKLTDREWRHMAETSARRTDSGGITLHYDPQMVAQFQHHPEDYEQWASYDGIRASTLVLRGVETDLLLKDIADEMTRRGPKARLVEFEGCGHAPALNVPKQFDVVRDFLSE